MITDQSAVGDTDLPEDPLADLESFKASLGSWRPALNKHLDTPSYASLYRFVASEYNSTVCYPPKHLIFNAFNQARYQDLKVVIVGQDPYIKLNEAMGMSFSIPRETKVPPSLHSIYKALENDPAVTFTKP